MSPANQVDIIAVCEFVHHILSKRKGNPAVIFTPLFHILVWVRPKQVAEKARIRYVSWPHDIFDRVDFVEFRGESSVHAKNFVIDEGCNGQAIEAVGEDFPELDSVAALTLIIKPVNSVDAGTLVVSSEKEEVLGEFNFVRKQQTHSLKRLLATVDVVAHEKVVCVWREAAIFEKSQ